MWIITMFTYFCWTQQYFIYTFVCLIKRALKQVVCRFCISNSWRVVVGCTSCRSTGPADTNSCWSCHKAAGLVAVDRPLFRTLQWTNMVNSQETNSQWTLCYHCMVCSLGDLINSSDQAHGVSCKLTDDSQQAHSVSSSSEFTVS